MSIHPTIKKILAVTAALILFIGVTRTIKWYSHFEVDPQTFNKVPDIDALMAEESLHVPQLKLAYQNGLTTFIDRTYPLQDLNRTLTIDRVWVTPNYANGNVYLQYHLDMHRSDEKPSDIPVFTFSKIVFTAPKGGKLKSKVHLSHKSQGHAYNRDFYRSIVIDPEEINAFHNTWFTRKLHSITLVDPQIISGTRTIKLEDISLEINHNFYNQTLVKLPMN
ncbi:MAG TPA: hypothetical protein VFT51_04800, partial [Bacillales bacterium]|nr:hypothetical protein [Bacillales bacterium]